ncbi:TRAP transporter small permease [Mameliella alba]|nr:TRAP transporter small permease [Mameliella alba]MBY6170486.1 TRAP transporter small permease [Mameliella alba]MBY6175504.1 TRAP transporter small permease [Mameliella alba]
MEPLNETETAAHGGGRYRYAGSSPLAKLELFLLDVSSLAILLLGIYIMCAVVSRNLFGTSIPDETVLVSEAMIAAVVLPLAFVAAERSFISVDIFMTWFDRSPKVKALLNLLGSVVGVLAVSFIVYAAWKSFWGAYEDGDYYFGVLSVPAWPGRLVFLIGYALFILRLLLLCWFDLRSALRPQGAPPNGA